MKKILYLSLSFVLFLSTALLSNAFNENMPSFKDVGQDHPYSSSIESLRQSGVVEGYDDHMFRPNNVINRVEFLKIVMEYFKVPAGGNDCFIDIKNQWFAKYVCSARKKGFVAGYNDGTFRPKANISFAEASKIIYTLSKGKEAEISEPWYKKYVESLADGKAIPFTITGFNHLLTRGEMAEIAVRAESYNDFHDISLSYDDLVTISKLSGKANFAYRFKKIYGHELSAAGVPDEIDYDTFKRIMLGTSACGFNADGSCELVESELYRDANRIYNYPPDKFEHKLMLLGDVDAQTFQVRPNSDGQYAFDKDSYYLTDKENPIYHKSEKVPYYAQIELNKAKFKIVYDAIIGLFVGDKDGFYYVLDDYESPREIESFDADKFKLIGDLNSVIFFSDGHNLYMVYTIDDIIIKKLDFVDLASFKLLLNSFEQFSTGSYFKDKSKMYYFGESEAVPPNEFLSEVKGVNVASLEVVQSESGLPWEQYFKDKNGIYLAQGNKMVSIDGADKETFEIVVVFDVTYKMSPSYAKYYLRDKNSIWIFGSEKSIKKLEGVSVKDFDYKKYLDSRSVELWQEMG